MNGITDMLSVVNGVKKKSSVAPIKNHRRKSISGMSGVAEEAKAPDDTW